MKKVKGEKFLSILAISAAIVGFLFFAFLHLCFKPYSMPSGSMENTLQVGDYLFSDRTHYLNHSPRRGEIMVFRYPQDTSKVFIKRCEGIPGDVIEIKDKALFINGQKMEESYVKHVDPGIHPKSFDSRDQYGPVTIETGHYFVLGDNRDNSLDSRYWGQLDGKLLVGRALFIYWRSSEHRPIWKKIE